MRVLQVCPYDWHAPGGVQTHIRSLAGVLRGRGHDVLVATPGQHADVEPWVHVVGRALRVPFNGTIAPICPSLFAAWRVRHLLHAFEPDVVHLHEPLAPSLAAYAGIFASAPVVATFHAHCDARIGPWLYACGVPFLNRRLAAAIAVSPVASRHVSERVRVPLRIVPNGVDVPAAIVRPRPRRAEPVRVLFAHRLEQRKGFRVAVDAFARLSRVWPKIEFLVVGDGPERSAVNGLPAAARAQVRMLGTVSRRALMDTFARADVFIAPALNGESFGIVLLEALAAGVPVVASDIDGYRGVLAGESGGLLVPAGDGHALACAVSGILGSADLAGALRRAGRVRAAAHSWDRIASLVEDVYDDVTVAASMERNRVAI